MTEERFIAVSTRTQKLTLRTVSPLFSTDNLRIRLGIDEHGHDRHVITLDRFEARQLVEAVASLLTEEQG